MRRLERQMLPGLSASEGGPSELQILNGYRRRLSASDARENRPRILRFGRPYRNTCFDFVTRFSCNQCRLRIYPERSRAAARARPVLTIRVAPISSLLPAVLTRAPAV